MEPGKDTTKEEIWRAGRSVLVSAGVPGEQAGSFLGGLVKTYGQPTVLDAVRAAVMATPAEPRDYLKATCQRLAGERKQAASAHLAARAARMAEAVPGLAGTWGQSPTTPPITMEAHHGIAVGMG